MDDTVKRPSADETEEDLLRFQREFLASADKPAAKVIRPGDKRKPGEEKKDVAGCVSETAAARDVVSLGGLPGDFSHTTAAPPVKKSKFKERRPDRSGQTHKPRVVEDPDEMFETHDTHISKILSEIVERDIQNAPVYYPNFPAHHGFPTVLHRGTHDQAADSGGDVKKKKSLFAQQFAHSTADDFGITVKEKPLAASSATSQHAVSDVVMEHVARAKTAPSSSMSAAQSDASSIHSENLTTMAAMSQEEILAEQKKLLEMLDPSLVQFLKDKHSKRTESPSDRKPGGSESMEVDQGQTATPETRSSDVPPSNQGASLPSAASMPSSAGSPSASKLPLKPEKEWVHMDKVEPEKLAWMKDLPLPAPPDSKTGLPARFDFHGHIVASDSTLPTHLGLHHHGDEPERAGYSLGELFQLARSANMQQRVLALKSIGCIIHNARHGEFHESLSAPIIPSLLDGGLVHILRWALDDSTENSMAAAVQTLHVLLVCGEDEAAADRVFHWYRGSETPELTAPAAETGDEEAEDGEKVQETEADVLKQDVIKGLLRMSLLQRLRYILEVWRPSAAIVTHILDILTRIARHSTQAAYEVCMCPRLLDTLFKEFLPTSWSSVETSAQGSVISAYGLPFPAALKVIRVICTAGRNMAASLVSKYHLMDIVTRFVSQDPSQMQLPAEDADSLLLESWRTWLTCAQYGLATEYFSELYSVLMSQLQGLSSLTYKSAPEHVTRGCALVGLLESVTHVAAASVGNRSGDAQSPEKPALPLVNWSQVTGLQQPIEMHLNRCLREFCDCYFEKKYDLSFPAACLNFVATVFSHCSQQPGYNAVETLERIEQLCETVLVPVLKSQAFTLTLRYLREHSVVLWSGTSLRKEVAATLPELGSLVGAQADQCPVLHSHTTVHFLLALTRLLHQLGKLHKGIVDKVFPLVLEHKELLQYVRRVCRAQRPLLAASHWARFENLLQYYLVKMAQAQCQADMKLYHHMSLCLLTHLHQGDEHLAHDLFSTVIFNPDFLSDLETEAPLTHVQEALELEERQGISSATQRQAGVVSGVDIIRDTCSHLGEVRAGYLTALASLSGQLQRSRARCLHDPLNTDRLLTGAVDQLLVPVDWPFLPLVDLYNRTSDIQTQQVLEKSVPQSVIAMVTSTLRWVHLLESWRPNTLDSVSLATKLSRIMCTFLAGSDLFLDSGVHVYLEALLRLYCKPEILDRLDFEKDIPGLTSFYDFYMLLLAQYEAVSFGDSLFGCYILLPLQQKHSVLLRRAVWGEHAAVLRSLLIQIKEVPIPLERFLDPEEQHLELLRLYFQALFSGAVNPRWCPLLYLVAVHHVNRFFYVQDRGQHRRLRQAMIQQIQQCTDQQLQRHLLYYKKADKDCEHGLDLYNELPQIRKDTLSRAAVKTS